MKYSHFKLSGFVFISLFIIVASQAVGQKDSAAGKTKNKGDFQKGRLLKIESVTDLQKTSEKAGYLLTVQGGASQYFAHYTLNYFQHDRSNEMEQGKDIDFRIDGKHLIVKTLNGDEIKMRLCEQVSGCVKCGGMTICGRT